MTSFHYQSYILIMIPSHFIFLIPFILTRRRFVLIVFFLFCFFRLSCFRLQFTLISPRCSQPTYSSKGICIVRTLHTEGLERLRSLRASSPLWANEASLARTRERAAPSLARSREAHFAYPKRRACSQATSAKQANSYQLVTLLKHGSSYRG